MINVNKANHPFVFKYSEEKLEKEYLGSDGLPISETYNTYLRKCDEFRAKGRKYAKDNLNLKNSYIHHSKYGYEGCLKMEEEVLLERREQLMQYTNAFDITCFDEDPNSMYECFKGKSKRIRIIRELHKERSEEFSDDFDSKRTSWFKRYCILSKFIQAARKIILLNRLEKAMANFRIQIPEIKKENDQMERGLEAMKIKSGSQTKKKRCQPLLLPCETN